jgi:hypothetical protein
MALAAGESGGNPDVMDFVRLQKTVSPGRKDRAWLRRNKKSSREDVVQNSREPGIAADWNGGR